MSVKAENPFHAGHPAEKPEAPAGAGGSLRGSLDALAGQRAADTAQISAAQYTM